MASGSCSPILPDEDPLVSKADLLVIGRIAALGGQHGYAWAEAIAIAGGRVVAAGTRDDVDALAGPRTRRLLVGPELAILPALADAHLHLADAAMAAQQIQLEGTSTLDDGLARVAQ